VPVGELDQLKQLVVFHEKVGNPHASERLPSETGFLRGAEAAQTRKNAAIIKSLLNRKNTRKGTSKV